MGKIKMKEIAALASVSPMTVSRAIHSPHMVRPETLRRIQRTIKKHNYVYDAIAADLSRKKSTVIGLITPTIRLPIFAETTYAIQEIAQEKGYFVIIGNSNYDAQQEINLITLLQQRRVAGIILTGILNKSNTTYKVLSHTGIPFVVTWDTVEHKHINYVGFDNFKASFSMTEYLIALKHKRLGLIIGPRTIRRYNERYKGYRAVLEQFGLPFDPSLVVERENSHIEGKEAINRLLSLSNPPTAVFGASGLPASMGALAAVRERGLKIPQDISIAGFGDFETPGICDPQLTTVRCPVHEMGKLAINVLFDMLEDQTKDVRQYTLKTELVIRGSCGEANK
jgi:DNA-binding LacI/PurR family transcriptional regulator